MLVMCEALDNKGTGKHRPPDVDIYPDTIRGAGIRNCFVSFLSWLELNTFLV